LLQQRVAGFYTAFSGFYVRIAQFDSNISNWITLPDAFTLLNGFCSLHNPYKSSILGDPIIMLTEDKLWSIVDPVHKSRLFKNHPEKPLLHISSPPPVGWSANEGAINVTTLIHYISSLQLC